VSGGGRPRIEIHGAARLLRDGNAEPLRGATCDAASDQPSDPTAWTRGTPDEAVIASLVAVALRRCAFALFTALSSAERP
jgi:hypothetical protein